MLKLLTPERGVDDWGDGAFNASRAGGKRRHHGVDFLAAPGSHLLSYTKGTVTKIGWPYDPNDPKKGSFRYVEVTTGDYKIRYFYIYPFVTVGEAVEKNDYLGLVQDLDTIYKGIPSHIHFEIKDLNGNYIDPMQLFTGGLV